MPSTIDSIAPLTATLLHPASPSPSPPNLGRKTSLIDLKDWVVDDGPTPTQNASTPLITLGSPPKPKPKPKPANLSAPFKSPPKLPPRKPSYTSLKPVSSRQDSLTVEHAHRYPPLALDLNSRPKNSSGHVQSSSISSFHSVSLSSDTDPSTPGSVANFIATFPMDEERHRNGDADSISLTESYEDVSTSSLASPATERLITLDWEKAMAKRKVIPPKLPERPKSATRVTHQRSTPPPSHPVSRTASVSGSSPSSPVIRPAISTASSSSTLAYTPRRAAPPPPPSRSSDRSSIQSNTTTNSYSSSSQSHHSRSNPVPSVINPKVKRPTPVPLGVRKRYEVVFNANIIQRRKAEKRRLEEKPSHLSPIEARGRRAAGWRGLSVDLITGDDSLPPQPQEPVGQNGDKVHEEVDQDEKLEGPIVRLIWKRSQLDSARLAEIWEECDPAGHGALSLDAFVKGMWRIDEELRRAQAQAIKSATSGSASYRSNSLRSAPKIPPKRRDILR